MCCNNDVRIACSIPVSAFQSSCTNDVDKHWFEDRHRYRSKTAHRFKKCSTTTFQPVTSLPMEVCIPWWFFHRWILSNRSPSSSSHKCALIRIGFAWGTRIVEGWKIVRIIPSIFYYIDIVSAALISESSSPTIAVRWGIDFPVVPS